MWNDSKGSATLWQELLGSGRPKKCSLYSWEGDGYTKIPWNEVARRGRAMSAGLVRRGVRRNTRVASILTNTSDTVSGVLGVWLAGGSLASLPAPSRGMGLEEYFASIRMMCEQLDPALIVVDSSMCALIPEQLRRSYQICSWQDLRESGVAQEALPEDDDLAFVQYSSGSTGNPKGCMLNAGSIARHIEMLLSWIGVRPGADVTCSWLPLSHDMGMFGTLLSSWYGDTDLYLSTPERFMMSPRTWFGDIAEYGGTITAGTNTGLYLSARGVRQGSGLGGKRIDMSACIIGAERIDWKTLEFAVDVLGEYGLTPSMFMPAYGMAETTLAVTAARPQEAPRCLWANGVALAQGEFVVVGKDEEFATSMVSAGVPIGGVSVKGSSDGRVGQLHVTTPSLASGYWNAPDLTDAHFFDGGVLTQDLGIVVDDNLYLVGRCDDMINIAGRNVYARAVEESIEQVEGVRRGCSTLLSGTVDRGDGLVLLLELDSGAENYQSIAGRAANAAMAKAAVVVEECLFLAKGTLPKTPSGKIQRYRCKQLLAQGRLDPWAVVDLREG